jgi:hypothetical protein
MEHRINSRYLEKRKFRLHMSTTAKQTALKIIQDLPDDVTSGQIREALDFRAKVDEGLAAIERGDTVSHDEGLKVLRKWRNE